MADIKRLHYFNHQFLVEADFSDEQQYHLAMRRRHNASLHGYGVADGLAVTRSGDREITVQPGMAIDRAGRELILLDSRIISLNDAAAFPPGATVHITIAYHEEESDPSTATGVTGNTRTSEKPEVRAVTAAPPGDGSLILLGQFALSAAGNVPGNVGDIFVDGRQTAGAALAPASVATDKVVDGAVDENKLSAGARGKLVTNGNSHDHSGGDGAQIRHSSLSLDGGSNPHATTAADVGALSNSGGVLNGNLQVNGSLGVGVAPLSWAKLYLMANDGVAGTAFANLSASSSDGSGTVTGLDVNAYGTGPGLKRGITVSVSGLGPTSASYFSAAAPTASTDYTRAIHGLVTQEGTGVARCLEVTATGSGSGAKEGLACVVSGAGYKQAGQFWAQSAVGSADSTNGVSIQATNEGTGNTCGLRLTTEGSGTGFKEGLVSSVLGAGAKRAAHFNAENPASSDEKAEGVLITASSQGAGDALGLVVETSGSGVGRKEGIRSSVSGAGEKSAGAFHANSDVGSADRTNALYALANSEGSGDVTGSWVQVGGSGAGRKDGLVSVAFGSGAKRAGQFGAFGVAGSEDSTNGVNIASSSEGSGEVFGLSVDATGTGTGAKYGIFADAQGAGRKTAGVFRARGDSDFTDGTYGVWSEVVNDGNGEAIAITASAGGAGTEQKCAVSAHVYGAGPKLAGVFRADCSEGSTDKALGLEVLAQSKGSGSVSGIRAYATGEGSGFKETLRCTATGAAGQKRAAYFAADNPAESTDTTEGIYVDASGNGTGKVLGFSLTTFGSGPGQKEGIVCTVQGSGHKYGGQFRAYSDGDTGDRAEGLRAVARSEGTGDALGLRVDTSGSGPALKQGILARIAGGGTGNVYGLSISAAGDGTGLKTGMICDVSGAAGRIQGGHFSATSSASSADEVRGVGGYAISAGSGDTHGVVAHASGSGAGPKYALYSYVSGNGALWAGYFDGNVHVTGTLSKASGTFLIDHPLDPENKTLRHSLVESPEDLCLYRGKVQLDASGEALVKMPAYFAALTREDDATVSLTAIGSKPFLAAYEWNGAFTAFTVYGEPGREVSYLVLADRDDPVIHQLRRPVEEKKGAGYFEKGQLLNPEAYGKAPRAAFAATGAEAASAPPPEMGEPAAASFAAHEEEHQRIQESWAKAREEQRQQMESFSREQEEHRKQLEESLPVSPQPRPSQVAEALPVAGVSESVALPPASPAAAPTRASAPARAEKTGADRKKR